MKYVGVIDVMISMFVKFTHFQNSVAAEVVLVKFPAVIFNCECCKSTQLSDEKEQRCNNSC